MIAIVFIHLLVGLISAILINENSQKRKVKTTKYILLTLLYPPLGYGLWRANRPLVKNEIRKGGKIWITLKWLVIVNTIMCIPILFLLMIKHGSLGTYYSTADERFQTEVIMGLIFIYWLFITFLGLLFGLILKNKSTEISIIEIFDATKDDNE